MQWTTDMENKRILSIQLPTSHQCSDGRSYWQSLSREIYMDKHLAAQLLSSIHLHDKDLPFSKINNKKSIRKQQQD